MMMAPDFINTAGLALEVCFYVTDGTGKVERA